ncbi:hypothetical protein [Sutcliffiella sp. BMC8]|uniref:hypothetical protein n=1 Tax=Sutcliffiella sp. BMC8 TaxID=3073243 RepID=UPI0030D01A0F
MKKLIILFTSLFFLVACSDEIKEDAYVEEEEKKVEMSENLAFAYLEQLTGNHLMLDIHEDGSPEKNKALDLALTELNITTTEIKDEYNQDSPIVKDLLEISDVIRFSIDEMLMGEYSTKYENSVQAGGLVGDFSRTYLEGKVPPTLRAVTGIESLD